MIAVRKSTGTIYYGVGNCFQRSLPHAGCVVSDVGNRALSLDVTAAMFVFNNNNNKQQQQQILLKIGK